MQEVVTSVKCTIIITLSDNRQINISLNTLGDIQPNITNYVTDISLEETLNAQNKNPVGVLSSNILKIILKSTDRSLFNDNETSAYYGFMNNTARVNIILHDNDGDITFNTFYVSNWTTNISSSNPYQVTIECTDLLSIVCKNSLDSELVGKDYNTSEALKLMIDYINESLDIQHKIQYLEGNLLFNDFPKINLDNIDSSKVGDWLNTLSQSTLTNIYIDRDNLLKTDSCIDDIQKESVCNLSDKTNITQASADKGGLVSYSGIKVNYVNNSLNDSEVLSTLSNQTLTGGSNKLNNITFNQRCYKVNGVRISGDGTTSIDITKFKYTNKQAVLELFNNSGNNVNATIEIYGQTLKENILTLSKSKNSSNEILEVTNKLLNSEYISKYTDNLLKLTDIKDSSISITGYFNPRIKLGNTVYIDVENSINTKGYYKVISLKWEISNPIKCTIKLIKTIAVQ